MKSVGDPGSIMDVGVGTPFVYCRPDQLPSEHKNRF